MPSRRWPRPVTRGRSARQSHKATEPKAPHVLSLESAALLHALRPFEKAGKNPDSKSYGIGPHDVANTDKRLKPPLQVTSAPNSIPGTVIPQMPPGSPLLGAIQNTATSGLIIPPTSTLSFLFSKAPLKSFSALPPLASLIATGPPSILTQTAISTSPIHSRPVETNATTSPNISTQSAASKAHALNLAVIILLAVGSALLLIGSCILIKLCTRPRRQSRPKPSLPILEDVDPEADFFEPKESPIFGGKERLSPIPCTGGSSWTWVPYSHTNLTQAGGLPNNTSGDGIAPGIHGHTEDNQTHVQTKANEDPPNILTTSYRVAKRQSTGAPSPRGYANVGQAITHDRHQTAFTAVGQDLVTQSRSKTDLKRRSHLGKDEKQRNRESSASTVGLAYDCEDADSPVILEYTPVDTTPPASYFDGRERIKSGYFASSTYPRMSTMPSASYSIATATRVNVGQRTSLGKEKFPNAISKRRRDTQALTYALGLATPDMGFIAPSPQPTLYPDDSMSVVDTKRQKKRNHVESIPDIPVIVPEQSTGQNGLKSMGFSLSQMSFSELTIGTPQENDSRLSTAGLDHIPELHSSSNIGFGGTSQKSDVPPRVPSPPLLPSLAQMALAQHNPEAYTNYRSPTYSLYGLYENPDRKSVIR